MARHVRVTVPLGADEHVVVVGAGLAGWRFVEAIRREGFQGRLTLIGEERHLPYDRPPLSKNVLVGKWEPDRTMLATEELVALHNVTLHLGLKAEFLDAETRTVTLADGSQVHGTYVVIATGTRARRLSFSAEESIHTIRTRDDVTKFLHDLTAIEPGSVIAVIGGGFIGAEAATALSTRGFVPLVLEAAERPLVNVLGPEVSSWLEGLASDVGIELRSNQRIADVQVAEHGFVLTLANGEMLAAAAVIEGAGALANVEWLASSNLLLDDGVVVDQNLMASRHVGAIGDVARFPWESSTGIELVRIEHWQVAVDHAAQLAHFLMTGMSPSARLIPYFWSDQYGKKIQVLGHPRASDAVELVLGSLDERKWLAMYTRDDVVTGLVALSQPRALMLSKPLLEQRTLRDDALSLAPWSG